MVSALDTDFLRRTCLLLTQSGHQPFLDVDRNLESNFLKRQGNDKWVPVSDSRRIMTLLPADLRNVWEPSVK
jgi:hypothetical protein